MSLKIYENDKNILAIATASQVQNYSDLDIMNYFMCKVQMAMVMYSNTPRPHGHVFLTLDMVSERYTVKQCPYILR